MSKSPERQFGVVSSANIALSVKPHLKMKLLIFPDSVVIDEEEELSFYQYPIKFKNEGITKRTNVECEIIGKHGTLTFTHVNGTALYVTKEFSKITYQPYDNFNGIDTIEVLCNTEIGQVEDAYLDIFVGSINDSPEIVFRKRIFKVFKDDSIKLGLAVGLFIIDEDARDANKYLLAVKLRITNGTLHLPRPKRLGGVLIPINNGYELLMVSPLRLVNRALQDVLLSFEKDWYGSGKLYIRCTDSIKLGGMMNICIETGLKIPLILIF